MCLADKSRVIRVSNTRELLKGSYPPVFPYKITYRPGYSTLKKHLLPRDYLRPIIEPLLVYSQIIEIPPPLFTSMNGMERTGQSKRDTINLALCSKYIDLIEGDRKGLVGCLASSRSHPLFSSIFTRERLSRKAVVFSSLRTSSNGEHDYDTRDEPACTSVAGLWE